MSLGNSIHEYVIYPRNGYIADGVRFVLWERNASNLPLTWKAGDPIPREAVLHSWWRTFSLEEMKRLYGDGITYDKIKERMAVYLLGPNGDVIHS